MAAISHTTFSNAFSWMKMYELRLVCVSQGFRPHYSDVIMGAMAYQITITSLTIVCLTVYSGADQRKHQSSASLAFMRGIHRWLVNSPHKWPVRRKMFPFDDVIMLFQVSYLFGVATSSTVSDTSPHRLSTLLSRKSSRLCSSLVKRRVMFLNCPRTLLPAVLLVSWRYALCIPLTMHEPVWLMILRVGPVSSMVSLMYTERLWKRMVLWDCTVASSSHLCLSLCTVVCTSASMTLWSQFSWGKMRVCCQHSLWGMVSFCWLFILGD